MERATQLEIESLKKGARVEVNFAGPGFRGSWFTGTIIRAANKRTNKIKVRFDNLFEDDKHRRKLKEDVDFISVRPIPPREAARSFELDEDVDAVHQDGWWEGVVTGVHPPPPPSTDGSGSTTAAAATYSVYLKGSREQFQFQETDLRLHREWVYGKWVPPLEEAAAPPPMEEAAAPPPMEEAAAPSPMEEAATPSPMEEAAAPPPKEEAAAPSMDL